MLFVNRKGRFISLCSLVDSGENQKRDTYFEFKKKLYVQSGWWMSNRWRSAMWQRCEKIEMYTMEFYETETIFIEFHSNVSIFK